MINPETCEITAATRTLALADTIGHSLTTEDMHGQARAALIDLSACKDCEIRRRAIALAERMVALSCAHGESVSEATLRVGEATEALRAVLNLARMGLGQAA